MSVRTALAERPGQPYPATFRKWQGTLRAPPPKNDGRRLHDRDAFSGARLRHMECAYYFEWTAGESNSDFRRAEPASSRWTSSPFFKSECGIRKQKSGMSASA